jgi:hypothetical protein
VQWRGKLGDPADAHEHHAEDHVMDVRLACDDVARPPADLRADETRGHANETEAGHERHEETEQRQPPRFHDLLSEPAGHVNPYPGGHHRAPGKQQVAPPPVSPSGKPLA